MNNIKRFAVIMSHADEPEEGVLCMVDAVSASSAQDECNRGTSDPESVFYGYDFTIWPVPVPETYGRCHWCPEMRHDGPCP